MTDQEPKPQEERRPRGAPRRLEGGKTLHVYIDAPGLQEALCLGDGNVSAGVRLALKQSRESNQREKNTP